ncbi:MAG: LysR family transcriptional regulator [Microbacterium sp.]|uniref:LysR family transcriptional regulator n=1 Tax=Microbacterium sp. TaxID=51671 RepID=UPI0039E32FB5
MSAPPRVDANLIVVLDAILTHRHLTRAGEAIGMAQPTMSSALARLRAQLGDPILVRSGRVSQLTPVAEAMAPAVRNAVEQIEALYAVRTSFDPATAQRFFLIAASEVVARELAAPVRTILREEGPHVTVDFDTDLPADTAAVEGLLQRRDAVIASTDQGFPGRTLSLYSDQLVVVVDRRNPRLRDGRIDITALAEMPQLAGGVYARRAAGMMAAVGLDAVAIVTGAPSLHLAEMVVGTPCFAIVPARAAARAAEAGVVVAETDMRPATIVEAAHWHPTRRDDAALQWFLTVLRRAAVKVEFPDGLDEQGR